MQHRIGVGDTDSTPNTSSRRTHETEKIVCPLRSGWCAHLGDGETQHGNKQKQRRPSVRTLVTHTDCGRDSKPSRIEKKKGLESPAPEKLCSQPRTVKTRTRNQDLDLTHMRKRKIGFSIENQ
jgi:hypothetical protein